MTDPTPDTPPAPQPSRWRHRVKVAFWIIVVTPVVAFALYTWSALSFSYSKGERAGIIQKFSRKGWLCRTWEGEIAMTTVPGSAPVLWQFTVRSDSIAGVLKGMMGQEGRVVLDYEEHRGLPTTCFGDTRYFVVGARLAR
ncbi:MAG TPA: hypothetical protein VFS28_04780 [Gemmatimonadales bacterium]|nr:hypothetical protein [Gemmatimonadales bacterium]